MFGRKLALAALALLFTCVALELLLETVFVEHVYYRPHERFVQRWPPMQLIERYVPNVSVRMTMYGDLAAMSGEPRYRQYRTVRFSTDAWGFCNPGYVDGSIIDTVILGDSFGIGSDTSEEDAWPAQLRRQGRCVYNLSTAGASVWQSYVNLLLEIDRLKLMSNAVVVTCVFGGNDLDEPYYPFYDKVHLPWQTPAAQALRKLKTFVTKRCLVLLARRALHSSKLQIRPEAERSFVIPLPLDRSSSMLFYKSYVIVANRSLADVTNNPNFAMIGQTLQATRSVASAHGLRLLVVYFPSKEEVYGWMLDNKPPPAEPTASAALAMAVERWCAEYGFEFMDLTPGLKAAAVEVLASENALLWWKDDSHMNALGQQIVGDIVGGRLSRMPESLNSAARTNGDP